MRFRKLRIAWSVFWGYGLRAADRVVGAELFVHDAITSCSSKHDIAKRFEFSEWHSVTSGTWIVRRTTCKARVVL